MADSEWKRLWGERVRREKGLGQNEVPQGRAARGAIWLR